MAAINKGERIMNVLVLDTDAGRRDVVADALSWISDDYQLFSARDLGEAREFLKNIDFRLVIVGPDQPCDTHAALVFLRGCLPHSALLTSTKMSSYDRDAPTRLLDCGADLVFDQRMSANQLSLVLRPYLRVPEGQKQRPASCGLGRGFQETALLPA